MVIVCPSLAPRRLSVPHFLEPTLRAAVLDRNLQRFVTLDGTLQRENRGHEDRWTTSPVRMEVQSISWFHAKRVFLVLDPFEEAYWEHSALLQGGEVMDQLVGVVSKHLIADKLNALAAEEVLAH